MCNNEWFDSTHIKNNLHIKKKKVMEKYSKQNKIEGNEFTLKYSFICARGEAVNDLCEKVLFYTPKITLSEPEKGDNYNAGNKLQWHPGTTIEITKAQI